jgi:hypothetical protein
MLKAVGVLSTAAMVKGIIVNPLGIDLASVRNGEIPILDSHNVRNPCLGYLKNAWLAESDSDPVLMGTLMFSDNHAGRRA